MGRSQEELEQSKRDRESKVSEYQMKLEKERESFMAKKRELD